MSELGLLFFSVSIIMIIIGILTLMVGLFSKNEKVKSVGLKFFLGGIIGLIAGLTLCSMS